MLRRLLDSPWTYYGLAIALALGAVASQFRIRVPTRSTGTVEDLRSLRDRKDLNVIFILIDTLRADHLSSYGYGRPTSPWMDELAKSGVRFARAEAQSSWTKCSMASLWTGLNPPRSGVTQAEDALPETIELPAERLRKAGYRTAGIWRNGWVGRNFGFSQGFDLYVRPAPSNGQDLEVQRRNPGVAALMGSDEDATLSAIEFIQAHGNERFFLYLHYMDVHQYVYDRTAADLQFGSGFMDAYDASIHWVDRNVGRIVHELDQQKLSDETILVIASDHGEGFTEHGEGHARTLYREVTHVPLIFVLPFRFEQGVVVEPIVRNIDIWPTLFDLLGMEASDSIDGRSLVPMIEAAADGRDPRTVPGEGDRYAYAYLDRTWGQSQEAPKPLVSVDNDGSRLIWRAQPENLVELFDHASDPTEQTDLAAQRPELVQQLRGRAEALLAAEPPWGESPQIELDEFSREQLRALGYIVK